VAAGAKGAAKFTPYLGRQAESLSFSGAYKDRFDIISVAQLKEIFFRPVPGYQPFRRPERAYVIKIIEPLGERFRQVDYPGKGPCVFPVKPGKYLPGFIGAFLQRS